MRYLLRPQGRPPEFDQTNNGCYNARRDNLMHFWKKQFGHLHGIVMMSAFYENVNRHDFERRPLDAGEKASNAIIEFTPSDSKTMFVPCLWSYWTGEGDDLYSFAVITDEPPREVSDAGHDRCVIQIREERIRDWLDCEGKSNDELFAILDDRPAVKYHGRLER